MVLVPTILTLPFVLKSIFIDLEVLEANEQAPVSVRSVDGNPALLILPELHIPELAIVPLG